MLASPTNNKNPIFRKPQLFNQFPELVAAESTRHGGVSTGHYASLNLGGSQDSPENIMQNNLIFLERLVSRSKPSPRRIRFMAPTL